MKRALCSILLAAVCFHLIGCRSYVFVYPYPWDYSKQRPKNSDMVGIYKILKRRLPSTATVPENEAEIILKADGTAVFSKVPWFDEFGQRFVCALSGSAKWELDDKINNGWGWSVAFEDYRPETIPTERRCDLRNSIIGGFLI